MGLLFQPDSEPLVVGLFSRLPWQQSNTPVDSRTARLCVLNLISRGLCRRPHCVHYLKLQHSVRLSSASPDHSRRRHHQTGGLGVDAPSSSGHRQETGEHENSSAALHR